MIARFCVLAAASAALLAADARHIDLAGTWELRLGSIDSAPAGPIFLPGSTDQAGYGARTIDPPKGHLTRPYLYEGPAWYERSVVIPDAWRGQRIMLFLERVHWQSEVRVDGKSYGTRNSLSTPHEYDLTSALAPGRHRIQICVDNTYRIEVGRDASSMTDHTQTNWNGIVGRIELRARPPVWIDDVQVYPDLDAGRVRVTGQVRSLGGISPSGEMTASVPGAPAEASASVRVSGSFDLALPMSGAHLWDEYTGAVYTLLLRLGGDAVEIPFGMRRIAARGTQFTLNGRPIFLRGTLECAIFPLTGYPPTGEEEWARIFRIAREYGLNAFRFHSYCPPEAAFRAADKAGFLLHVELPVWSHVAGKDAALDDYMRAEGRRILEAYGNHPSFTMLCLGNELSGDDKFLDGLVAEFKASDPRRLYTFAADYRRRAPGPTSDYYVTQQTTAGRLRINGTRFGRTEEGTDHDFTPSVKAVPVPLVAHELGQWAVDPDLAEIAKYTGVLKARNLEVFRDQLAARGLLTRAHDFQLASGRFSWAIYKEEMEAALRTPDFGGFFLLELEDFPGQGEALVGLLDSFWDSKGILTPSELRQFCGPVVPLARMKKFVWKSGETFEARAEVANYSPSDLDGAGMWRLADDSGRVVEHGDFPGAPMKEGAVTALGSIRVPLGEIRGATHLKLTVGVPNASNSWNVWVYPDAVSTDPPPGVTVATTWEAARAALAQGRRVLLHTPQGSALEPTRFLPIFWSKAWGGPSFTQQPAHMGILCDPKHPALADFPTAMHSDFQWWELAEGGRVFVLNDTPQALRPIVQVIDDFHRGYKLGSVFEAAVGPGKLLAVSYDLSSSLDQRPVARQLLHSLLHYAAEFAPEVSLTPDAVAKIIGPK